MRKQSGFATLFLSGTRKIFLKITDTIVMTKGVKK
jgi:hypothetical protein